MISAQKRRYAETARQISRQKNEEISLAKQFRLRYYQPPTSQRQQNVLSLVRQFQVFLMFIFVFPS